MELLKAKKEVQAIDAEADRRGKIASLFCKAFERAVLLTPTEENVRIWVENTRMRPDEIEDSVKEARELAETFSAIADVLERLPCTTPWQTWRPWQRPGSSMTRDSPAWRRRPPGTPRRPPC